MAALSVTLSRLAWAARHPRLPRPYISLTIRYPHLLILRDPVATARPGPFRWDGAGLGPRRPNAAAGHPHRAGHPHSESLTIGMGGPMPPGQKITGHPRRHTAAVSSRVTQGIPAAAGRETAWRWPASPDAMCPHLPWLAHRPFHPPANHRRRNACYPHCSARSRAGDHDVLARHASYWLVTLSVKGVGPDVSRSWLGWAPAALPLSFSARRCPAGPQYSGPGPVAQQPLVMLIRDQPGGCRSASTLA
jgi:hypothetical protein